MMKIIEVCSDHSSTGSESTDFVQNDITICMNHAGELDEIDSL
jgi:hypothetical protein